MFADEEDDGGLDDVGVDALPDDVDAPLEVVGLVSVEVPLDEAGGLAG